MVVLTFGGHFGNSHVGHAVFPCQNPLQYLSFYSYPFLMVKEQNLSFIFSWSVNDSRTGNTQSCSISSLPFPNMFNPLISPYSCCETLCQDAAVLSTAVFRKEQSWLLWCVVVLLLLCRQINQINLIGDMQRRNKSWGSFASVYFFLRYQYFVVGFSLV